MSSGSGERQAARAGANGAHAVRGTGTPGAAADAMDPQILESIFQATLREHGQAPLPPALETLLARHRGDEPDEALVAQLVSAALGDFWSAAVSDKHRQMISTAVAQRLADDPQSMERIRRLLGSDARERP